MTKNCVFLTNTDGSVSDLSETLKRVTNTSWIAAVEYAATKTPEFKKWFAHDDWEKAYSGQNHSIPSELLTQNGEPQLFKNDKGYYFQNIYGQVRYISASKLSDFSVEDLQEIVADVSSVFIKEALANYNDIREAIKNINTDIKTFIKKYISEELAKVPADSQRGLRLSLILKPDNLENLTQVVKDNFKRFNIDIVEEVNEEDKTSGLNLKDSTSINSKDRASVNIKLMVAFSPQVEIVNGQPDIKTGSYIGGILTNDFDTTWRALEDTLADTLPNISYIEDAEGNLEAEFNPLYERFIEKLAIKAVKQPSLYGVYYMLVENDSQYLRHQFVQALLKNRLNMVDTVVQSDGTFRIMSTEQNTPASNIAKQWNAQLAFLSDLVDSSTRTINKAEQDAIVNQFNAFKEKIKTLGSNYQQVIPELIQWLNRIKITDVTPEMIIDLSGNSTAGFKNLVNVKLNYIADVIQKLTPEQIFDREGDSINPFEKEKTFKLLAEKVAEYTPNASETTIMTKGGLAWLFDLVNFVNLKIDNWSHGEKVDLMNTLQRPYYRNSIWGKRILEAIENDDIEFFDKLKIVFLNNFRKDQDVKDNKDITLEEQVVDSIVKMFLPSPMLNMLEPADKSRFMHIQGFDVINPNYRTVNNTTGMQNREIYDVFFGYFMDEYSRVAEESDETTGIEYYDKNKKSFILFKNVMEAVEQQFPEIKGGGKYLKVLPDYIIKGIRQKISEELHSKINATVGQFKELGILESLPSNVLAEINKSPFPEQQLASMYVINGLIANIEMTKLFTGDPAYYKNITDFKKRVPATYTNGMMLNLLSLEERFFSVAIARDVKIGSAYLHTDDEYISNVAAATNASKAEIKEIMEAYQSVERTDAQAYITPQRWRFLLERLGKFDPAKEAAYNNIINGRPTVEDLKIAAQPLKGVFFDIQNGHPVYLKYSQSVLIPALVNGTQLQALADKMNDPNNKVDELIFLSGTKVGAQNVNVINDAQGNLQLPEKLNTMQLDNRFWKLQQDLPNKGVKDTAIGSQIQKTIFADFDSSANYNLNGKIVSGTDLQNLIDNAFSTLSNRGANKVRRELLDENGEIDKNKVNKLILNEVRRSGNDENLIEAIRKGLPYDTIPSFKQKIESVIYSKITNSTTKIKMSGAAYIQMANFGLDRLTNKEASGIVWLKDETDLKPPLIEDGKLKPGQVLIPHSLIAKYIPNYKDLSRQELLTKIDPNLLELIGYRIPNQGMSSNDFLEVVGILPETVGDTIVAYSEITNKTGSDFDIDKMYVMLPEMEVVYKSNYRVVEKFVTETDNIEEYRQILLNNDIITEDATTPFIINRLVDILTNSEFETEAVDLLELQDEFTAFVKENPAEIDRLVYIDHNGQSDKAIKNRIFQGYKSILTHVNTYLPLITSIDKHTSVIKAQIPKDVEKSGFDIFDPLQELISKKGLIEGKNGVGTTANNLVDHVISQLYPLMINENIGFGHKKDGKTDLSQITDVNKTYKISDIISGFLNAFVDIAKDPYILRGNFNDVTTNTAFLLLRAGTPISEVAKFIGQPALVQYAKNKTREKSSITSPFQVNEKTVNAMTYTKDEYKNLIPEKVRTAIDDMSLEKLHKDYLSFSNLSKNITSPDPITQYAVLTYYDKLAPLVSGLQRIVRATKSDVTGATSTAADRQVFVNNYNEAILDTNFSGVSERFNNTRFKAFYENSVGLAGEIGGKLFLTETDSVRNSKNTMLLNINEKLLTVADAYKLLNSDYYAFLLSNTSYANKNPEQLLTSIPQTVLALQKETNNYLLKKLVVKQVNNMLFVDLDTSRRLSDTERNYLYKAWLELFDSDNSVMRMLARDLIQYSYQISGFKPGIGQFFAQIPHDWVGWEFVDLQIKELKANLVKDDILVSTLQQTFERQFVQHHYTKTFNGVPLVTNISSKSVTTFKQNGKIIPIKKAFILKTDAEVPNKYLKMKASSGTGFDLYELQGFDIENDGYLYTRLQPLGMDKKGHKIFEYSQTPKNKSVVSSNNVELSFTPDIEDTVLPVTQKVSETETPSVADETQAEMLDETTTNKIKEGVSELFDSNLELANAVYEALGFNIINEAEITYTDEDGKHCAKIGLTNTTKGTGWKIVKDFKGKPKHSQGGVDITISDKGVTMRRGGKDIKAKYGLLITNNN